MRYDLKNPGHRLRPGMFATVTLKTPVAETPMFQKVVRRAPASRRDSLVRQVSLTAEEQKVCPVTGAKLGSMGEPVAVEVKGRKVWTCCKACPSKLKTNPEKYLAKLGLATGDAEGTPTVEEQKICPVTGAELGSMGDPILVEVKGRKVWTCCKACPPKLKADPDKYLARLAPPPKDTVLSVPESAVIDTGALTMVYVEAEPGVYEGRKVVLGPRSGDRFPVLEGLAPGEKVVAAGAFLVDAESRLNPSSRPAASKDDEAPPDEPAPVRGPMAAAGHDHQTGG